MNLGERMRARTSKPCPFCGSRRVEVTEISMNLEIGLWVRCDECSAIGPTAPSKLEAIRDWNAAFGDPGGRKLADAQDALAITLEDPKPERSNTSCHRCGETDGLEWCGSLPGKLWRLCPPCVVAFRRWLPNELQRMKRKSKRRSYTERIEERTTGRHHDR